MDLDGQLDYHDFPLSPIMRSAENELGTGIFSNFTLPESWGVHRYSEDNGNGNLDLDLSAFALNGGLEPISDLQSPTDKHPVVAQQQHLVSEGEGTRPHSVALPSEQTASLIPRQGRSSVKRKRQRVVRGPPMPMWSCPFCSVHSPALTLRCLST